MFLAHHRRVFYSDLHPLICLKRKLHVCCNQTQRRQRFRKTLDAYLLIVCNFVAWQHDFCAHFLTHTISRASKWLTANGQSIVLHNEFVLNQNFLHSHHLFSPDFASWFLLNCLLHSRACTTQKVKHDHDPCRFIIALSFRVSWAAAPIDKSVIEARVNSVTLKVNCLSNRQFSF